MMLAIMTFPFESLSGDKRTLGLVFAVLIGIAFGFVLERAGFGNAHKLVGQFYGREMAVLKVMFTAVVTAMLGVVILSAIPVTVDGEMRTLLDLRSVQLNYPTYLWPMIVGGVILGAGFVTSGYCPGTSWVAAASGKLDGLAAVGGVVLGGMVYAEVERALAAFPNSGVLGAFTIPTWLHLPAPVVAAGVVAIAIAAFVGAEKIEKIMGGQAEASGRGPARKVVFTSLVALAIVALVTLGLPVGSAALHLGH